MRMIPKLKTTPKIARHGRMWQRAYRLFRGTDIQPPDDFFNYIVFDQPYVIFQALFCFWFFAMSTMTSMLSSKRQGWRQQWGEVNHEGRSTLTIRGGWRWRWGEVDVGNEGRSTLRMRKHRHQWWGDVDVNDGPHIRVSFHFWGCLHFWAYLHF